MRIYILLLALLATNSYAGIFDSKLQAYECKSSARDSTCKKIDKVFFEFKTNKEQRFVLMSTFRDGNPAASQSIQNCSIIDNKNWSCENSSAFSTSRVSMTNGTYHALSLVTYKNQFTETYMCAK
jgi:hypothetical protein